MQQGLVHMVGVQCFAWNSYTYGHVLFLHVVPANPTWEVPRQTAASDLRAGHWVRHDLTLVICSISLIPFVHVRILNKYLARNFYIIVRAPLRTAIQFFMKVLVYLGTQGYKTHRRSAPYEFQT
jgi:hypothetical protein